LKGALVLLFSAKNIKQLHTANFYYFFPLHAELPGNKRFDEI
jgi:hypothetical protein